MVIGTHTHTSVYMNMYTHTENNKGISLSLFDY